MKKRTKILLGCIAAVAVFVIGSAVYVSGRLPEGFGIDKFTKGIIATDLKHEPFIEVSTNEFFFKDGNLETVIEQLEDRSILFDEQFGSALIFTYGGTTVKASLQAITRWHFLLTIDALGATTEPDT